MKSNQVVAIIMFICIVVCSVLIFKLFAYAQIPMGFNIPTVIIWSPVAVMISVLIVILRFKG